MAALGSLVVQLGLNYAQFTGGADAAEQRALQMAKRMQDSMDRVKASAGAAAGALLGAVTAGAVIQGFRQTIDELDRVSDAADKIGVSAQNLAELGYAAKMSGTDAESLESSMGKLSVKVAEAVGGGKEAVKTFDSLGIKLKDAEGKVRSSEDVFGDLADFFQVLPDGVTKTALAVDIFGKSGKEMVPMLSKGRDGIAELREEFVRLSGGSQEAARALAGELNDQLDKLAVVSQGAYAQVATQLLPAINDVAGEFTGAGREASTMSGELTAAGAAGAALATFFEAMVVLGANVVYVFKGIGREIGGVAAQMSAFDIGFAELLNPAAMAAKLATGLAGSAGAQAANIRKEMLADAEQARADLDAFEKRILNARQNAAAPKPAEDDGEAKRMANRAAAAAAEEKARKALAATGAAAAKTESEYAKLMTRIGERIQLAEIELKAGRTLTEQEKFAAKVASDMDGAKKSLTAAERAHIAALLARSETAQLALDIDRSLIKSAQDLATARQTQRAADDQAAAEFIQSQQAAASAALASVADRTRAIEDEMRAVALSADGHITLAYAVEQVAIARLKEKQAGFYENSEGWENLQREIEQRTKLLALMGKRDAQAEVVEQAKEARGEWTKFTDSVYQGLTDSLFRSFEAGKGFFSTFWSGIKNTFKTSVLKLLVQGVMSGVTGIASSAATAAGLVSAPAGGAGGVLGGANLASSAFSLISGAGSALASGVSSGLTGFFAGEGGAIIANGISSAVGASTIGGASFSIGSVIGAAAPYALAAVVALNALGVFRSEKKTDVGFKGTLGAESDVSGFTTIRKGGTLFSGPSYRDEQSALPAATKLAIDQSVGSMFTSVKGFSDVLGLNSKAIDGFTKDIFISTQGLTDAQIQEKLAATFKSLGDDLANLVAGGILSGAKAGSEAAAAAIQEDAAGALPVAYAGVGDPAADGQTVSAASALDPFRRAGESAIDTLGRLANSLSGANAIFDSLGQTALKASLAGGAAASALVDLFGGMDKFGAAAGSFLQEFYTPAERAAITTRQLTTEFDKLGLTLPKSRDAYREMVELYQTKLDTEEGRKMYAALLQLGPVFASITEAAADSSTAAQTATAARQQEIQIMELQGDAAGALAARRADELAAMDPLLREKQKYIHSLQDEATAAAAATARATASRDQDIQILELQGNAAGALAARREDELAAMDPLLREKQRYIYSLQDEAAATAAASAAKAEADARAKEIGDTQFDYEQRLLRAQGRDREALDRDRAKEYARLVALNPALAVLANNLWLAEDAATAAAAAAEAEAKAKADRDKAIDDAYAAVQRAVDARKSVLSEMQSVQQAAVSGLGSIAKTLKSSIGSLLGEVTSVTAITAANGMAYIRRALVSGVSSDEELQAAIAGVRANMGEDRYATREEFDRDRLVLAGQLSELEEVNGVQLTTAEKQLKTTQDELKRLDDMLRESKTLVDTMKGVDTSVLSVAEAIDRLHKAMFPAKPAGTATGAGSSAPGGAVVGAGPSGGAANSGSYLGRQANGSYVFSDGYISRDITGADAARLDGAAGIVAQFSGTGNVKGYYEAMRDAGFSLRDIAARDGYYYGDVLAAAAGAGVPAFEAGGMHSGGLRIVGERGWELEASGQSRIWNQQQLAAAFGGGGAAANDQIVVELRLLSAKVEALQKAADTTADNTRDTVKSIRNVTGDDGKSVLMKAAA
ncbi:phage tail tape measure protein [Xylophilus sp. Leaf220]|uniref:phage tail tape measure protein n=1 Tax=Xylophilus sp. Leaf220 TaxID=1735686 RepID=UPI0006FC9C80|nr:phage tail tape measure protein [Xylophilus sp. Leaf220]KQM68773.1 hypothetical protein ASE76_13835 [Xylophilus sp. Leaf220]